MNSNDTNYLKYETARVNLIRISEKQENQKHNGPSNDEEWLISDQDVRDSKKELEKALKNVLKDSNTNNSYFDFCSFDVYQFTFSDRLNSYLDNFDYSNEKDFIKEEVQFLKKLSGWYPECARITSLSLKRRKEFLKQKLKYLKLPGVEKSKDIKKIGISEAIHLFDKLLILEFLEHSGFTKRERGQIISKMTGHNADSVYQLMTKQVHLKTIASNDTLTKLSEIEAFITLMKKK